MQEPYPPTALRRASFLEQTRPGAQRRHLDLLSRAPCKSQRPYIVASGLDRHSLYPYACRIAAFRLRQVKYLSSNTVPLREQVRDSVEFVRIVWEEIERSLRDEV